MESKKTTYGYYRITIKPIREGRLLCSNNERAFVLSQLQDLLSPRLLIGDIPAHKQLASCIDLIAFSIRDTDIRLVLFAIDQGIVSSFTQHLMGRVAQYQTEYQYPTTLGSREHRCIIKRLSGPHRALHESVGLHLLHDDWEFDRYSSIGFYLHDRRGDWMRLWRVSQLYENDPANYTQLMTSRLNGTFSAGPIVPTEVAYPVGS